LLLLITIEPKDEDKEKELAEEITSKIRESATDFRRLFERSWLLEVQEDVDWWTERLVTSEEFPARALVVRVEGRVNGLLPGELWDWINERAA